MSMASVSMDQERRVRLLYHFSRIQQPLIELSWSEYVHHLERMFQRHRAESLSLNRFIDSLFPIDALVAMGCLSNQARAWEVLFSAHIGRADRLFVDALRQRAARLLPGNEEQQETAVQDFWGHLLVPPVADRMPILHRYDGMRPLIPWLIRVFQNRIISQLRSPHHRVESLSEDDLLLDTQPRSPNLTRWQEAFREAAQSWLHVLPDRSLVILGLRWRYRLSQREIANLFHVHEGTISRQIAQLRDQFLATIKEHLESAGWFGEDVQPFILQEMQSVLLDEPKLSANHLSKLLQHQPLDMLHHES